MNPLTSLVDSVQVSQKSSAVAPNISQSPKENQLVVNALLEFGFMLSPVKESPPLYGFQ